MAHASAQLAPPAAGPETGELLQHAFASFTESAAALEVSYRQLQGEVARLRQDLEQTHFDLEQTSHDLEETQEILRRKQALAEMSAMLAHEIRNPLGSMELLTALLSESPLDSRGREWNEQLRAGVRMLAATVNNVLEFYGPSHPELLPLDLGELFTASERFLRPVAQQSNVRIVLEHDLHGVFIAADRHRLQQVLFNLALNAFRAMAQSGTLRMRGYRSRSENLAVLEFEDSGCGIPEQHLGQIFLSGFTTRRGSPGIGLAVCKELVEQHQGTISVVSAPERGTTFTLRFPVMDGEAQTGSEQETEREA
jgi:two-component system sensor histidine kinase FlrB